MTNEEKFNIITTHAEEILLPEDLKIYIEKGIKLKHYIGFEISGKIHLGTGLVTMQIVKDLLDAGAECTILLADWHSWINNKLGGDMHVIQEVAVGYFKEGMKASLKCLGADPEKVHFILGSDLYNNNEKYWATFVDVCKNVTLSRNLRSISIMGRKEGSDVDFSLLLYPPMQVADIFIQGLTIAHGGMEQRKAHVIMRDVALKMQVSPILDNAGNKIKPVAIHNHLLLGLQKPPVWPIPSENVRELWVEAKMSKSKPDSCVFIHDEPADIRRKIMNAFCPPDNIEFNPVLDWIRHIVFVRDGVTLLVKREAKHGGDITFDSSVAVEKAYMSGELHSQDLKRALAEKIIEILEPARKHFAEPQNKKMLDRMNELVITR